MKIKEGVDLRDFEKLTPNLLHVMSCAERFFKEELVDKDLIITSLVSDYVPRRTSKTHQDGRAFDCRVNHLSSIEQVRLVNYINNTCKKFGAITNIKDNKKRVILIHGKGKNKHAHFQVHS